MTEQTMHPVQVADGDQAITITAAGLGPQARAHLRVEVAGTVLEVSLHEPEVAALARALDLARVVVADAALTSTDPGYYVCGRDSHGNIRMAGGAGALIAGPTDDAVTVAGWLRRARPGSRHAKAYQAALDLLTGEGAAMRPRPEPGQARTCPGCGQDKRGEDLCCDSCWARIPTSLPYAPHWRTRVHNARREGNWTRLEAALDAAHAWLIAHPREVRR
ncbi:hypothetical protein CHO01_29110 [Cellulomonas hominis]|uniref:Uncharacterized protein n=1 Tax=Cellulomonas hominis TaxID=156981 RepID=A0A511FEW5_9CELL|nr:hypothetical protein [Cellulomonas hominis]MBB5474740.1 hypothetical protein [Cellulomonas hominis]NKY05396.1 hypothetical protein [Cellulomonas hominis]GEL47795.1 hypothetical protein CHO01_29110 [Cellulomonas hominis]